MRPAWVPWQNKTLDEIGAQDLRRLKDDEVSESYFIEYKSQWDAFKVSRSIASFANTEGGTVVVGVADESMVPVAVEGIQFTGNPLESIDQAVRSHITPIPMYSTVAVSVADDRVCLVIEIPSGYDTPYVLVKTGQILERSNTSSGPIPPQNRDRIKELFGRGKSGKAWADQQVEEFLPSDSHPHHLRVWTIPQVEGGLNLNAVLYRESFVSRTLPLAPVPFAHSGWNPRATTPGYHLVLAHALSGSYECVTEIGLDGVLFTGWSLVKDTSWVPVRPDLPEMQIEEDNFFAFRDIRGYVGTIFSAHHAILDDLIGYAGPATIAVKAIHGKPDQLVTAYRSNVATEALSVRGFHEAVGRDLDRSLGRTVFDPD